MQYVFISIYKVDSTALVHFSDAPTTIIPANALDFCKGLVLEKCFTLKVRVAAPFNATQRIWTFIASPLTLILTLSLSLTLILVMLVISLWGPRQPSALVKSCLEGKWAWLVLMMSSEGRHWCISKLQQDCVNWQVRPAGAPPPQRILFFF